ncbi:MAG: hypothetical protein ACE5KS_03700 [Woeseiaceae bacterium]
MKIVNSIGSLLKLAIAGACIYAAVKWGYLDQQADENSKIAERNCVDAIGRRPNVQSVSIFRTRKSDNGYVVSASATFDRGSPVKFYCLTNRYGGIDDVSVEGR